MKKVLSMILVFAIVLTMTMPVLAQELPDRIRLDGDDIVFGDYRITIEETEDGSTILREYKNDRLVQKNTVPANSEGTYIRQYYGENGVMRTDVGHVGDYLTVEKMPASSTARAGYSNYGTVVYSLAYVDGSFDYRRVTVDYATEYGHAKYDIVDYTGSIINLITDIVAAGLATAGVISGFIGNLLAAIIPCIVGDVIESELTTTVNCETTRYSWYLHDTMGNSAYLENAGTMYYVTDTQYHTGERYYEGLTPQDWGSVYMASEIFDAVYPGDSGWNVSEWIR